MRPHRAAAAGVLLAAAVGGAAAAQPAGDRDAAAARFREIQKTIEEDARRQADLQREVAGFSQEIADLRSRMIATARAVQDHEEALSGIEVELTGLQVQAESVRARLRERRGQLAGLLAAAERAARHPPAAVLLGPTSPLDAARGALLLKAALPPLQSRVKSLGEELQALERLAAEIAREREQQLAAALNLRDERARLDQLVARMIELKARAETDSGETARRIARLAADAKDLQELLARLSTERPRGARPESDRGPAAEPPAPGQLSSARGSLLVPARGRIVKAFGQSAANGLKSRGITIATRGGGQVVAPAEGRVAFAGPFRGYGQLLIIAGRDGYHVLLAGLSRIDCVVGQWLQAGEPVGVMGPAGTGDPELYVELRRDGEPINPLPWMAARDEKVDG